MRITLRSILLVLGVLGVLFLGLLIWVGVSLFGPAPAIVVSRETTYLTEPLAADGLPDYGQALLDRQRAGVTPENNGAIPFWQAMWPGELSPEQRAPLLSELGMSEPERGLVDPYKDNDLRRRLIYLLLVQAGHQDAQQQIEAYEESGIGTEEFGYFAESDSPIGQGYEKSEQLLSGIGQPWTARQIPPLAAWVEDNEALLDLLVVAGERPKFYSPSPSLLNGQDESLLHMQLPSIQTTRHAVRLLRTRALLRIAEGRHADAWRDLRACYGLAEHLSGQHMVISELVSIACAGITDEATLHLLDQPDLSDKLIREISRRFQARELRTTVAAALDQGERFSSLDVIIRLSRGDLGALSNSGMNESFNAFAFDWNLVLRDSNEWYDRLAEAGRLENWQKRQKEMDQFEIDLAAMEPMPGDFVVGAFSRSRRSQSLANVLNVLLLPAMTIAFDAEDRANARLELMRLAAALAVYRAENGAYPESLEALVPDVLDELPVDLFHQKPFHYERTETGYMLYSLGPNGLDEEGSNSRQRRYKGYAIEEHNEAAVRELLGEPFEEDTQSSGDEHDEGSTGFGQDDVVSLDSLIPPGADDHAIRLPLPVVPLAVLQK